MADLFNDLNPELQHPRPMDVHATVQQQAARIVELELRAATAESQVAAYQTAAAVPTAAPAPTPQYKIPAPAKYTGHGDPENFLQAMREYLENVRVPHADWKRVVVAYLADKAFTWYRTRSGAYRTVEELTDGLRRHFGDPRKAEKALAKWRTARQRGSVAEYTDYYNGLILHLPATVSSDGTLRDMYLDGLRPEVRAFTEASGKPSSLIDAQERALLTDAGYRDRGHYSSNRPTPMEIGTLPSRQPKPVAQGSSWASKVRNGSGSRPQQQPQQQQQQQQQESSNRSHRWPPPYKPTNPCPFCHSKGHWGVNCPKQPAN